MEQLIKIESLGLADKYYEICNKHPMRIGDPIEKMPYREVLKSAEGKINILKLKGPGTVFDVQGLPETVLLRFIVQSRTTVETHFELNFLKKENIASFATMCLAAKEASGKERQNPPYPRPQAHSLEELIEVFVKLRDLALEFDGSID